MPLAAELDSSGVQNSVACLLIVVIVVRSPPARPNSSTKQYRSQLPTKAKPFGSSAFAHSCPETERKPHATMLFPSIFHVEVISSSVIRVEHQETQSDRPNKNGLPAKEQHASWIGSPSLGVNHLRSPCLSQLHHHFAIDSPSPEVLGGHLGPLNCEGPSTCRGARRWWQTGCRRWS